MFRNLRDERYDIDVVRFQDAIQQLSFKRDESFPVGLFMKAMMTRTSLDASGSTNGKSLMEEFGLSHEQVTQCLEHCAAFWKKVYFITTILKQQTSID